MMPPMLVHAVVVGDHGHAGVERVGLAVERQHRLARPRASRTVRSPVELVGVEDVQRPAEIDSVR